MSWRADPTYRGPVTVALPSPWKPLHSILARARSRVADWLHLGGHH
ncbi:MAG TPA: hypothetical protein VG602_05295 [Actinomycetota bacterium]|nr:hypothetical protein [Actinomycetota bacterium]